MRIEVKTFIWCRVRIRVKIQDLDEEQHHIDEEQDSDPHRSEKRDPDMH
jgi:hypothetical protein